MSRQQLEPPQSSSFIDKARALMPTGFPQSQYRAFGIFEHTRAYVFGQAARRRDDPGSRSRALAAVRSTLSTCTTNPSMRRARIPAEAGDVPSVHLKQRVVV